MFDKFFKKHPDNTPTQSEGDIQIAVAALLVEAAKADDEYAAREVALITRSLASLFDLSVEDAEKLRAEGETAQQNALDIHQFTKVAKTLEPEEKVAFIENLWEIVLSDGVRDPFEDALMRRICGLIYLDDRESGKARQRVEQRVKPS